MLNDLTPRWKLWFERRGVLVAGEREAELLDAIDRTRSIKEAARATGISYRTAWACLQAMEKALGRPVVHSRAGGPGGGTTALTEDSRELVRLYAEARRRLAGHVEREFQDARAETTLRP